MKKHLLIILLITLFLVSCSQEQIPNEELEITTPKEASIESEESTDTKATEAITDTIEEETESETTKTQSEETTKAAEPTEETINLDFTLNLAEDQDIDEVDDIDLHNNEWLDRIETGMGEYNCQTQTINLPEDYYQGPLIDSHLHIPAMPDHEVGEPYEPEDKEEENLPLLGINVDMAKIACTLKNEGTINAFAFFPIYPEIPTQAIEIAKRTTTEYEYQFIPFIMPPTATHPTVEKEILEEMLSINPDLFLGLGEIGDSPTEPINPKPNDPLYIGNYQVAQDNNLVVMYHPADNQEKEIEEVIKQFPNVKFLVHGDGIEQDISSLMDKYPNIYYSADHLLEDLVDLFREGDKEEFISELEQNWDSLLKEDIRRWKDLIEDHPNRTMWGTDRSDIYWNYDEDIGLLLTKYARAFIAELDPEVQEKYAYENAEAFIGIS